MGFLFSKSKFVIVLMFAVLCFGLIYIFSSKETLPPKVYRIAIDETWYPLQMYDKEQYFSIFSKELLKTIAEKQHFLLQIVQVGSSYLFTGLDEGDYEGVLSSFLIDVDNPEKYISSKPFYLLGPVLVVLKSSTITSLNELNGKTIGVVTGQKRIDSIYNNKIELVFYEYDDRFKMIDDVLNQKIEGMLMSELMAYEYTSGVYQDQLKIVSAPLTNDGLRLIAKDNPESKKLIEQFNEGLKAIKKEGIYNQLLTQWELHNPARD